MKQIAASISCAHERTFEARLAQYRLRAFHNSVNGFRSKNLSRTVMADYRGRNRTEWPDEDYEKFKAVYGDINYKRRNNCMYSDNDDDDDGWILDAATGFQVLHGYRHRQAAQSITYVYQQQRALEQIVELAIKKTNGRVFATASTSSCPLHSRGNC